VDNRAGGMLVAVPRYRSLACPAPKLVEVITSSHPVPHAHGQRLARAEPKVMDNAAYFLVAALLRTFPADTVCARCCLRGHRACVSSRLDVSCLSPCAQHTGLTRTRRLCRRSLTQGNSKH
jgi:hypothetical protein